MRARRTGLLVAMLVAGVAVSVALLAHRGAVAPAVANRDGGRAADAREPSAPAPAPPEPRPADEPPAVPAGPLRYVAIGGGSFPESSEVSLEQNLQLAQQVLAGPGALLFGGGTGSFSVRVLDDDDAHDGLLQRLGDVFAPRGGRRSRYRHGAIDAPSTRLAEVEAQLRAALESGSDPLLVFVATHGDQGERPADNQILLWGGDGLTPKRLAELHEAQPRPLRLLLASCFSGGFAELAFAHADEHAGFTAAPRCGLFAGTADRETSGCDPDPERRNQEGYSLHVLQALRGRDREGAALPLRDLDHDGDGKISLLEAHAWATIAGQSIDVPTTTSERWLRALQLRPGRPDPDLLPEHAAVVARLGARLGLDDEAAARARWEALDTQLGQLDDRVEEAQDRLDALYGSLAGRLLARWPVLDDPYHAEFAELLDRDRAEIGAALRDWPEASDYFAAEDALAELESTRDALEADEAAVFRLVRAHETLRLAGALRARGGEPFRQFERLLACERFVPSLAADNAR